MKVLVIGDAILDHYVYGKVNRQSPEDETIPVIDVQGEEYRLGGCLNVATNIRSLSYSYTKGEIVFDVSLSSIFSKFTGDLIERRGIRADSSCINVQHMLGHKEPSQDELIKTRVINVDTKKQLIRIDNRLKYKDEDIEFYKSMESDFNNYDAIVVSDYCKGLVNKSTITRLQEYEGQVFVDTKQPDLSIWKNIKNCIVKVNRQECNNATGMNHLEHVIVTEGEDGATYLYFRKSVDSFMSSKGFPTESVKNPEVTGCGDVFLAAFIVKYMRTKNIDKAIKFANKAATTNAKKQGTSFIRYEEIM